MESGGCSFLQNVKVVIMKMVMMKMAAVSTITLLLLCCSVVSSTGSKDGCDHSIIRGANFIVPQKHPLKTNDLLMWTHNATRIYRKKEGRCSICSVNVTEAGSLILNKVEPRNAGRYNSTVYTNGVLQNQQTTMLCVLDRVPKPEVKFECSTNSITFKCISTQDQGVTYQWLQNDKVLAETSQTLKWKNNQAADSFKCKLSNPVSNEISAPVIPNCIKSVFPKTLFGLSFWIMVGILAGGAAVVLVLIIIVIVCCTRARRKRRMQVKEEEELRLGWAQQQHHHHHHQHQHNHPSHHQQQPAGHTGPRQHRSKRPSDPQRLKVPESQNPKPSPRNTLQRPTPVANDEEHPPPLPQPRKKAPRTPRL